MPGLEQPIAAIKQVSVTLGRRQVLHDINFHLRQGDFCCLIGPNGAGKSTMLGLFNGLIAHSRGVVEFKGQKVDQQNARHARLAIAHVFQMDEIDPKMPLSVYDSVLAGSYGRLGLFKKPGPHERSQAEQALAAVGLSSLAHRPLGHLSGGERQRTAIARALAQEPELLLLDEPTAALDWQAQREILNLIKQLQPRYGLTVLMVTHDLNAVSSMARQVAMLKQGRLIWQGDIAQAMDAELLSRLYGLPITLAQHHDRVIALF